MDVRFGIWDHFERRPGLPLEEQYQQKIALLQEAERLGFVGYHIAEHHLTPLDMAPSPNVFLAALAQATTRLRIGTMVYILPLYHPARLVQEICMLDNLSAGRLDVGVGRGIRAAEHEWYGIDPVEARARTEEILEILVGALCSGNLRHRGTYYDIPDAPLNMLPKQRPYPPLWYAGGIDFAGQRGLNFLGRSAQDVLRYWETFDRSVEPGLNQHWGGPVAGITRHVVIRSTMEEAVSVARRAWEVFQDNWHATEVRLPDGRARGREDFDTVLREGTRLLLGTPETITTFIDDCVGKLEGRPNFYFAPAVQWGDISLEEATETMRLFAEEIF